jgi:hypothetical protein
MNEKNDYCLISSNSDFSLNSISFPSHIKLKEGRYIVIAESDLNELKGNLEYYKTLAGNLSNGTCQPSMTNKSNAFPALPISPADHSQ